MGSALEIWLPVPALVQPLYFFVSLAEQSKHCFPPADPPIKGGFELQGNPFELSLGHRKKENRNYTFTYGSKNMQQPLFFIFILFFTKGHWK